MICPKCHKINRCGCKSCNPNGNLKNLLIKTGNGYQCCFCGNKFNEWDSLNYEWNLMIKDFISRISPQICLDWAFSNNKNELEKKLEISEYGFNIAFRSHFKMNYKTTTNYQLIQLKRNLKINNILN